MAMVNDIHGQLNPTRVARIARPRSIDDLRKTLAEAARRNVSVSVAGGRHAMGGQQFASDGFLVDTRSLNRVLAFDHNAGTVTVQGGIQWPELVQNLLHVQRDLPPDQTRWGIAQKQTGANRMTLAGSIASNTHGRGLTMKPLVSDVVSLVVMDASGHLHKCSRNENRELFSLVIGGYGLFGIVTEITLKLAPRRQIERIVRVIEIDDLMNCFNERIAQGFLYGDFQYMTDERADGFMQRGVFSCYRPVDDVKEIAADQKHISDAMWQKLLWLAHYDKARAFQTYADYYMSTSGQRYWSDTHQLAAYQDDYHKAIDKRRGAPDKATEVICEIFVPRDRLVDFLAEVKHDFRENAVNVIYGTLRLIERDDDTFLPWAKQAYVGVIFNLHTVHTPDGIDHAARAFRRLIDMGIARGGSYYLTYHRFATRAQVEACYPQFAKFLRLKCFYDPAERFQSDWYRHYKNLFAYTSETELKIQIRHKLEVS